MVTSNDKKVKAVLENLGYKFPIKGVNSEFFASLLDKYNKSNNSDVKCVQATVNYPKADIACYSYPANILLKINSVKAKINLWYESYGGCIRFEINFAGNGKNKDKINFAKTVVDTLQVKFEDLGNLKAVSAVDDVMNIIADYCRAEDIIFVTEYFNKMKQQ